MSSIFKTVVVAVLALLAGSWCALQATAQPVQAPSHVPQATYKGWLATVHTTGPKAALYEINSDSYLGATARPIGHVPSTRSFVWAEYFGTYNPYVPTISYKKVKAIGIERCANGYKPTAFVWAKVYTNSPGRYYIARCKLGTYRR